MVPEMPPVLPTIITTRSGEAIGCGRSQSALTSVNTSRLAPTPSASVVVEPTRNRR